MEEIIKFISVDFIKECMYPELAKEHPEWLLLSKNKKKEEK